jgi:hypothetical protein
MQECSRYSGSCGISDCGFWSRSQVVSTTLNHRFERMTDIEIRWLSVAETSRMRRMEIECRIPTLTNLRSTSALNRCLEVDLVPFSRQ